MGGTTAKVSLVQNGEPDIAQGYYIGGAASGHPVMLPVVDIIEVGAGGGSIAWIDEVGALKVGPRSAGGHPGPVCYGQGGTGTDRHRRQRRPRPRQSRTAFWAARCRSTSTAAREAIRDEDRRAARPRGRTRRRWAS